MNLIDYIGKNNDKFVFYYYYNGTMRVEEVSMGEDSFIEHTDKLRCSLIIQLYEDFLNIEKSFFPAENPLQTYNESKAKIRAFITWAFNNPHLISDVLLNANRMIKKANIILNEIPFNHECKKDLIFLLHCVTLTTNTRITI